MNRFRCKVCGRTYESVPKVCACGNFSPVQWEAAPAQQPAPVQQPAPAQTRQTGAPAPAAGKKKRNIPGIIAAVLLLAVVLGGAAYFLREQIMGEPTVIEITGDGTKKDGAEDGDKNASRGKSNAAASDDGTDAQETAGEETSRP